MKGFGTICAVFAAAGSVVAADPTPQQLQFFETKIRPVLANHCYACHSVNAEKVKGGLLLDSREGLLKGGDSGVSIVPGHPEQSRLIKAISYSDPDLEMPPKGKKLAANQIADLTEWVRMGAPDPRSASVAQRAWKDNSATHWAWQPPRRQQPPAVSDRSWIKTPVDQFIVARLAEKGMQPNRPAEEETLLRRAYFDLIGLPPTIAEMDAFVSDTSSNAFEKVVDKLLASPHYGERWGRHWLDTARFADTKGEIRRQREDELYPHAWTYRDYVIRSFNEDKPYNVFIAEQIAADKLGSQNKSNLAALGFLTIGERFRGMQHDIINDRIDVVTKGFQGLTVSCARCHDHKFDPIPQKDYYALHGVFASTREPELEPVIENVSAKGGYPEYYEKRIKLLREEEQLQSQIKQMRGKRDPKATKQLQRQFKENAVAVTSLENTAPGAPARAMILEDLPKPRNSPLFIRGEAENKGAIVPRHYLSLVAGPNPPEFRNGSGRFEMAAAIASKSNPLTARVMINRIWQHHFGEGFVLTPDDFGTMSEPPSHRELLDYLSVRFMDEGWSIKKMHKLIMLSAVYQQSSATNPRYAEIDPYNRLLWRANIRRLEFEPLRDSLLDIAGTLDRTLYGRSVDIFKEPYSTRRSIYGFVDRQNPSDTLVNFDFANPDMTNGKRHQTTVPQQALFFMNSPLVVESAKNLVRRKEFVLLSTEEERIRFLYRTLYQRSPTAKEIDFGIDFLAELPSEEHVTALQPAALAAKGKGKAGEPRKGGRSRGFQARAPLTAWQEYAHGLIQANEFSFVN